MGPLKSKWEALSQSVENWMHRNDSIEDYVRERSSPFGRSTLAAQARASIAPRILTALLIVLAVLMLTFVAATTVVRGFASEGNVRLTRATIEQYAAAEYRRARVRCQKFSSGARAACIAEAHAAEAQSRVVDLLADRDYKAMLRSVTDAGIDAGERDSIVVEPACNIVERGTGTLCEIQRRPDAPVNLSGTNLVPVSMDAAQFAAAHPLRSAKSVEVRLPEQVESSFVSKEVSPAIREYRDQLLTLAWASRQ